MQRSLRAFLIIASCTSCIASAAAQDTFGKQGQLVVSADRLFGAVLTYASVEESGMTTKQHATNISLLTAPLTSRFTGYSFARVAFDYLVIDGLSLGLAAGYFHIALTPNVDSVSAASVQIDESGSGVLVAPRVGYAYMFASNLWIWPRAGVTWLHASTTTTGAITPLNSAKEETVMNQLALTVEVALAIVPLPHVGIWLGPTLDLGLTGSQEFSAVTTSTQHVSATDIGLQTGLFVYF